MEPLIQQPVSIIVLWKKETHITPFGTPLLTPLLVANLSKLPIFPKPLECDTEQFTSSFFSPLRVFHDGRCGRVRYELVGCLAQTQVTDMRREGFNVVVNVGGIYPNDVCLC